MDNRPIGVFDSGLGGLTSVQELHRQLPEERVIYLGDTARTPYGSKSPETIVKFAIQNVDYLVARNTKMIIIACNTVTAVALDALKRLDIGFVKVTYGLPVYDLLVYFEGKIGSLTIDAGNA